MERLMAVQSVFIHAPTGDNFTLPSCSSVLFPLRMPSDSGRRVQNKVRGRTLLLAGHGGMGRQGILSWLWRQFGGKDVSDLKFSLQKRVINTLEWFRLILEI